MSTLTITPMMQFFKTDNTVNSGSVLCFPWFNAIDIASKEIVLSEISPSFH
jgi:hypothetical protein